MKKAKKSIMKRRKAMKVSKIAQGKRGESSVILGSKAKKVRLIAFEVYRVEGQAS